MNSIPLTSQHRLVSFLVLDWNNVGTLIIFRFRIVSEYGTAKAALI